MTAKHAVTATMRGIALAAIVGFFPIYSGTLTGLSSAYPELERLFEQAKQDFWNDTTAIDWEQPLTLSLAERKAMAKILRA